MILCYSILSKNVTKQRNDIYSRAKVSFIKQLHLKHLFYNTRNYLSTTGCTYTLYFDKINHVIVEYKSQRPIKTNLQKVQLLKCPILYIDLSKPSTSPNITLGYLNCQIIISIWLVWFCWRDNSSSGYNLSQQVF